MIGFLKKLCETPWCQPCILRTKGFAPSYRGGVVRHSPSFVQKFAHLSALLAAGNLHCWYELERDRLFWNLKKSVGLLPKRNVWHSNITFIFPMIFQLHHPQGFISKIEIGTMATPQLIEQGLLQSSMNGFMCSMEQLDTSWSGFHGARDFTIKSTSCEHIHIGIRRCKGCSSFPYAARNLKLGMAKALHWHAIGQGGRHVQSTTSPNPSSIHKPNQQKLQKLCVRCEVKQCRWACY